MVKKMDFNESGLLVRIPTVIYPPDIVIMLGGISEKGEKRLKKLIGPDSFSEAMNARGHYGLTTTYENGCSLVQMDEVPVTVKDYSVLVHEIFHAIRGALNTIGVFLNDKSEEAFAYLLSYVTEKAFECIDQWRASNELDEKNKPISIK